MWGVASAMGCNPTGGIWGGVSPHFKGCWYWLGWACHSRKIFPRHLNTFHLMKTFLIPLLAFGGLLLFPSCETTDYDEDRDDDDDERHGRTTTTTTEETRVNSPFVGGPVSRTIQTQTTQTR